MADNTMTVISRPKPSSYACHILLSVLFGSSPGELDRDRSDSLREAGFLRYRRQAIDASSWWGQPRGLVNDTARPGGSGGAMRRRRVAGAEWNGGSGGACKASALELPARASGGRLDCWPTPLLPLCGGGEGEDVRSTSPWPRRYCLDRAALRAAASAGCRPWPSPPEHPARSARVGDPPRG